LILTQKKKKALFLSKKGTFSFSFPYTGVMEKGGAAYCLDCDKFFSHEKRDIFSGEVYCPACSGRAWKRYRTIKEAKADNKKIKK
jgi:Zn finger protein HypA/HybF involved in hydrogenase expression